MRHRNKWSEKTGRACLPPTPTGRGGQGRECVREAGHPRPRASGGRAPCPTVARPQACGAWLVCCEPPGVEGTVWWKMCPRCVRGGGWRPQEALVVESGLRLRL